MVMEARTATAMLDASIYHVVSFFWVFLELLRTDNNLFCSMFWGAWLHLQTEQLSWPWDSQPFVLAYLGVGHLIQCYQQGEMCVYTLVRFCFRSHLSRTSNYR